jgi:hypothetical protein
VLNRLKVVAKKAEEAGVIIGIETTLPAKEEAKLLDKIHSSAIKSYVNFSSILKRKGDIIKELKTLGKNRIAQIHVSNTDGFWIENDPALNMSAVKKTLDEMDWSGWLVVERSRDVKDVHNVKKNYGANAKYLKTIFGTSKAMKTTSSIIEIVGNKGVFAGELEQFCQSHHLDASVYQWNNHTVLYGTFSDLSETEKQIAATYPDAVVKTYAQPFYVFDRRNCEDKMTVERWSHTVMTANLVADSTMQQEYMNYHATQAGKFPEVANGFCHANFQQVLVFRNGQQLMLVISIPEGENLDELNPKTTENNPRVDDWNAIMATYQEGIEGTMPEETWVVLSPVIARTKSEVIQKDNI